MRATTQPPSSALSDWRSAPSSPALPPDAETLPGDGGAARFRVSRSRFVPSRHSRRTRAESSSSGSGPGKSGSKSSGVGAGGPRGC